MGRNTRGMSYQFRRALGETSKGGGSVSECFLAACLTNKDLSQSARARIDPGRRFASASAMRLTASAVDATTGVMLGGAAVDDFGAWTPKPSEALLPDPMIVVEVPATSACLVTCVS